MADKDSRIAAQRYSTPAILDYLQRLHTPHDPVLDRVFAAPDREGIPAIQVGPAEAKTLHLLLRLISAKKVVEIGTLAGYSGMWMARALPENGMLYTIEANPKHAEIAQRDFDAAGLSSRVTVLVGKGVDVLPTLEDRAPFDAVFIDADKASYDHYGRWAARNLRPGGLLLGDNAYFFGNLLDESDEAAAMRRFHEEAARAFDTVCLPTPDGLLLGVKR